MKLRQEVIADKPLLLLLIATAIELVQEHPMPLGTSAWRTREREISVSPSRKI